MSEPVDHPGHYGGDENPYEAIKVIDAWTAHMDGPSGFNVGNALKYIFRAGRKSEQKHAEDLRKAIWYLTRQLDRVLTEEQQRATLSATTSSRGRSWLFRSSRESRFGAAFRTTRFGRWLSASSTDQ